MRVSGGARVGARERGPAQGPARVRRRRAGFVLAAVLLTAVTAGLLPLRGSIALGSVLLLYLLTVVMVAVAGGPGPAVVAAVTAVLAANFFYTEPLHTLWVDNRDSMITLVVFVVVAGVVAVTVDRAARRREDAVRAEVEARLLARWAASPVHEGSARAVLDQVREVFGWAWVRLVRVDGSGAVRVLAASGGGGAPVGDVPGQEEVVVEGGYRLVAGGPETVGQDRGLMRRLAVAAVRAWQTQELAGQARRARELAEQERVRTALLAAVGHDLRTPLAGVKAAVSSLRQTDVHLGEEDRQELLALIEAEADRLGSVLGNLLDMSRIEAGVVQVDLQPVLVEEVVARAVLSSAATGRVLVEVGPEVPAVLADAGLLERVVGNLVANAVRFAPRGEPVVVRAEVSGRTVRLLVVDTGPGLGDVDPREVFVAFRRAGDARGRAGAGVGLGLAIVKGFTEAMGGTVVPSMTAGGGLTMCVELGRAS